MAGVCDSQKISHNVLGVEILPRAIQILSNRVLIFVIPMLIKRALQLIGTHQQCCNRVGGVGFKKALLPMRFARGLVYFRVKEIVCLIY